MQFKFKTMAAAALLAAASLPSFAVISTTATPSLVLFAFDIAGGSGATYYRDLGSVTQVLNATGNVSFAAPTASIFSTTFANVASTDIAWGVIGVSTVGVGSYYLAAGKSAVATTALDVNNIIGGFTGTFGTFGALDLASNGYAKANGEYTGNAAADNFASNALDAAGRATLQTYDLGLGLDTSLNLFKSVGPNSGTVATVTQINTGATNGQALLGGVAGGYFTLTSGGNLTWAQATSTPQVGAVPVPAAALLFGPALLAMAGVGRRNKKSV